MQSRAVFVVAFLLFSNAALAESRPVCQSMPRPQASSCDTAGLPGTLRSEAPFAQTSARSLCRRTAPLCTRAINYSTRQQWASSQ
ncbi:hypothetical protein V1286_007432 [Bradyrhizobium algeriense]|uniref:DUF3551 domain-containing protein n=1 Tax=Bradyrhizobium algeriense TaxID=634784 RepID=A0ABU8BMW3_9BRAD